MLILVCDFWSSLSSDSPDPETFETSSWFFSLFSAFLNLSALLFRDMLRFRIYFELSISLSFMENSLPIWNWLFSSESMYWLLRARFV